jgi:uncharacterized membrane protein
MSAHETDSPILPIAQLERLKEIAPERVDWVFEETGREGNHRREETTRVNTMVFAERMLGIVAGLAIGCTALWASYVLAMNGHDAVAGVIGGTTVVGLVSAFVIGVKRKTDGG